MSYVLAALLGLVFGTADQYLGTLGWLGPWTSTAAQVSAPWLVLPFLIGTTERRSRRAMALGLVATVAALLGYFAMTYSPMEIHPWSLGRFASGMGAVASSGYNPAYLLGGIVFGPLFGWLGQRWRVRRAWFSAVAVAGVLCLEPLARLATGQIPYQAHAVWVVEVAIGTIAAASFLVVSRRRAIA
jgi:uncharacterized membrane protein (UPF0136 family)